MAPKLGESHGDVQSNIRAALNHALGVAAGNIAVTVDGPCADLFGNVDTEEQREQTEDLVRGVAGVTVIRNHIALNAIRYD